jgi:hypothetical protein
MANEIGVQGCDYDGANPLYFVAYAESGGQFVEGTTLEPFNAAHWDSYAIAMPLSGGNYLGSFPAVPDGVYCVSIYEQIAGSGGSPAPSDPIVTAGDFSWCPTPPTLQQELPVDAALFLSDFGEQIGYNKWVSGSGPSATYTTTTIQAVINRNAPVAITEDSRSLVDNLEIAIANVAGIGITAPNQGRDTVTLPSVFGSSVVTSKLVTQVVNGDQGMWVLRVK